MIDDDSVGYFATAASFMALVMFLPGILSQTITPMLVKLKRENELAYLEKRQIFTNIMVWGTLIISVVISLNSYCIIKLTWFLHIKKGEQDYVDKKSIRVIKLHKR